METTFVKYSRERSTEYQIKTMIFNEDNKTYVSKQALNDSAKDHVNKVNNNYKLLHPVYKQNILAKPLHYEEGSVLFEYLEGISLEQVLLMAAIEKELPKIYTVLDMYTEFLDNVATEHYCDFYNSPGFISFFGNRERLVGLKSFKISNIDLNLDNIIMDENGEFKVIDYEWVLDFSVPLNFIKFRAINNFYYSHFVSIKNLISIEDIFTYIGISKEELSDYIDMSNKFADMVGTDKNMFLLEKYLKRIVPFEFDEPPTFIAQLFTSANQEFIEEESLLYNVSQTNQIINYDLTSKGQIKNIRFDPLQGNGTVCIKDLKLIDLQGNSISVNEYYSNADWNGNGFYIFFDNDPQIYYEVEEKKYASIQISIAYFDNLPEEISYQFLEQTQWFQKEIEKKKNHLNKLEADREQIINENSNLVNLNNNLANLNNNLVNLNNNLINEHNNLTKSISDIEMEYKKLQENFRIKEEDIRTLNQKFSAVSQENLSLTESLLISEKQRAELNDLVTNREQIINEMISSKWWRLGLFLKKIVGKR
ncbi:hypothetical protein OIN60_06985 [Paenibacillus sp. P96]|uniref:Protein kinase domain-containing protein n=1 Tax=Paenibacillus zeirhizosphaerae TaxID=2987519 RepID=A0ABT9FP71_9BACL|nr:hypothetical protein [Paenibacillus sp. P96]MDP4096510.1 hypothetical protein [Paenibacillus sp. P96]